MSAELEDRSFPSGLNLTLDTARRWPEIVCLHTYLGGGSSAIAAQRSAPPQTPTSRSREPPSSPFSPLVARASELLDDASAKSGVPKQTLAAAAVGAAVAAGVALVGIFGRRRR